MQYTTIRAAVAACLFGAALWSAPVIGGGSFDPFGANPTQNNTPFWDTTSHDGSGCGVGYVLTQTASINNCGNKRMGTTTGLGLDPNDLEYYSLLDNVVSFTLAAGQYEFTLHAGMYGAALNQVGYRYLSGGSDQVMFDTFDTVGATFVLDAVGEFALYLLSDNNPAYRFQSNDASGHRAAAFHDNSTDLYYFGFEDRPVGDRDYNDMVISASYLAPAEPPDTPTPEPATFALIGFGLIAVSLLGKRRRTN